MRERVLIKYVRADTYKRGFCIIQGEAKVEQIVAFAHTRDHRNMCFYCWDLTRLVCALARKCCWERRINQNMQIGPQNTSCLIK